MMRVVPIEEESRVGEARRLAAAEAARAGCDADQRERVAIVATELASNLLHHAREGEMLVRASAPPAPPSIDLIAVDSGPGIPSVERAMVDGFTTRGGTGRGPGPGPGSGLGCGLGGVRRLSERFDIYSDLAGTTAVAGFGAEDAPEGAPMTAGLARAKAGESVSGDAWAARPLGPGRAVMLVDALGHGEAAGRAARAAVAAFLDAATRRLEDAIEATLAALSAERGAAALFAELPAGPGPLRAWGLGNIRGELVDGPARNGVVSNPGVAGRSDRRRAPIDYPWTGTSLLVLTTDGLREGGRDGLPLALRARSPLAIAATLMKRRRRGGDDAGVVVVKGAAAASPAPFPTGGGPAVARDAGR